MGYVAMFFAGALAGIYITAIALRSPMDPEDRAAVNDMIFTDGYRAGYEAAQAQARRQR